MPLNVAEDMQDQVGYDNQFNADGTLKGTDFKVKLTKKGLFLTYSNVDQQVRNLTPEERNEWITLTEVNPYPAQNVQNKIMQVLCERFIGFDLNSIVVARELHADTVSVHFHVYMTFNCSIDAFMGPEDFVICGVRASIEKVRNPFAANTYCRKDNDFVEYVQVIDLTNDD